MEKNITTPGNKQEIQPTVESINARLAEIAKKKAEKIESIKSIENRLNEIAQEKLERVNKINALQAELNRKKLEKLAGDSKKVIANKVDQMQKITDQAYKYLVRRPLLALGIVATTASAIYGANAFSDGKKVNPSGTKEIETKKASAQAQEFNEMSAEVMSRVDTEYYKDFSRTAREAYLSRVAVGIAEEKNPTIEDTVTSVSDSSVVEDADSIQTYSLERAPKPADYIEQFGTVIRDFESRGNYRIESDSSSAVGAYQFLASWLKYVDLDPNSDEDYEYYRTHPEIQDRLFRIAVPIMAQSIPNFNPNNPKHIAKLFAVYFVGPEGASKYGTPAGDYVPKKNSISLNNCVRPRVKDFLEVKEATKNPGWWLTDKEKHTKYWVQQDGKVTYETDIYKVYDNSEDDLSSARIGTSEEVSSVYKIADVLDKKLGTVNYAEEHAKLQKKIAQKKKSEKTMVSHKGSSESGGGISLKTKFPKGGF